MDYPELKIARQVHVLEEYRHFHPSWSIKRRSPS